MSSTRATLSFERGNDPLARKVGGADLVWCVGHDLVAGEETGLYELANLVMAHTKLRGLHVYNGDAVTAFTDYGIECLKQTIADVRKSR
jgi:hypothetical protein